MRGFLTEKFNITFIMLKKERQVFWMNSQMYINKNLEGDIMNIYIYIYIYIYMCVYFTLSNLYKCTWNTTWKYLFYVICIWFELLWKHKTDVTNIYTIFDNILHDLMCIGRKEMESFLSLNVNICIQYT